jgi:hypothetical protein
VHVWIAAAAGFASIWISPPRSAGLRTGVFRSVTPPNSARRTFTLFCAGTRKACSILRMSPKKSQELLYRMAAIFIEFAEAFWRGAPLFYDGYFDAQYSLWAPGPIVRMQEDATAVYSPALYRKFVLPVDRMIASRLANSFIHLHSTSMFLLEAFLECEEIRAFEVNNDASGPPLAKMIPRFQTIQNAGKPLLVRGTLTPDEARLLMDSLDSRGLFLNIMVKNMAVIDILKPILRLAR